MDDDDSDSDEYEGNHAYKRLKKVTQAKKEQPQKNKKTKLVEFYHQTEFGKLEIKSKMFDGMEFYVINVDSTLSKPDLEKIILENGGKRVQNLMPTTTHLIAAKECFRVRSIVQQYKMNII